MVTIDGKTYFGNEGCTPIEVEPFEPLCSHDPVAGTDPLLLDVPVPSFVPAVPPNECACFTFIKAELDKDKQVDPQHKLVVDGRASDAKFAVEILPDPNDCCTGKYTIAPNVQIPCLPFEIGEAVVEQSTIAGMGSIDFRLEADACTLVPHINIKFPQPGGLVPCTTELKTTPIPDSGTPRTFGFKVVYKSKNNVDPAEKNVEFSLSRNPENGDCPVYTLKSGGPLDLTDLATGSVSNGGGVNLRDGDDTLWLNGEPNGEETWYGGSLGNSNSVDGYAPIFRGTVRRNGNGPAWGADLPIPYVTWNQHQLIDDENKGHTKWTSRRLAADGKTFSGDGVNLDMLVPTGFQWHDRGVACTVSRYIYTPSGLLASLEEDTSSPILAPGLACWADGGQLTPTINVSGLSIHTVVPGDPSHASAGLRVNYGDGLRIYGDGEPTTGETEEEYDSSRQGCLEIMYGYGFRVVGAGGFLTKPVDIAGAITLHYGNGLRLHGVDPTNHRDATGNGALEVDFDKGLEIGRDAAGIPTGKLQVKLAAGKPGLAFDAAGGLKTDGTADHTHGRIDNAGCLMDRGAGEKDAKPDNDKVLISGSNGALIQGATVTSWELRGLFNEGIEFTPGPLDNEKRPSRLKLYSGARSVGMEITAGGNGTDSGITFSGINTAIGGSISYETAGCLNISSINGDVDIGVTGDTSTVTLRAPKNQAVLAVSPTLTATEAVDSTAIASCGWVISKAVTRADNTPAGVPVVFRDAATAQLGPSGIAAVPDDSGKSNGRVLTAHGNGTATWEVCGINLEDLEENKIITAVRGTDAQGNQKLVLDTRQNKFNDVFKITSDAVTVKAEQVEFTKAATQSTTGDVVWEDGEGKLTRMNRLSSEENVSDFEALSGICRVFYRDESNAWKLPTTALKMKAGEHSGKCLLVVDNEGNVDHSLNSMYDTLAALESDGIAGPIAYSGGSGGSVTFEGLSKVAFGSDLTDVGSKTVVFQQGDDVATLVDGLPVTLPDDLADGDLLAAKIEGTGEQQTKGVKPVNVGNGITYTSETGKTDKLEVGKRNADFMFHANTDTTKPAWLSLSDRRPTTATKRMVLQGKVPPDYSPTPASENFVTTKILKWYRSGARGAESNTDTTLVQKDSEILIPIVLDVERDRDNRVAYVHRGYLRYTRNGLLLCAGNIGGAVGWTNDGQSDDARAPDSNVVD